MRSLSLPLLLFSLSSGIFGSLAQAQPIGTQAIWGEYLLQYADPVGTYPHGVFGQPIEPTAILDLGDEPYFIAPLEPLPEGYVFEDRLPRFIDMEGDGEPEVLTIVTNPSVGAGVWLWGRNGQVRAKSAFHGQPYRWLNPVLGSADLDRDGDQELAIIRTPHIGSVLEVLDEREGEMHVVLRQSLRDFGLSNHRYGDARIHTSLFCQTSEYSSLIFIQEAIDQPISLMRIFNIEFIPNIEQPDIGSQLLLIEDNQLDFRALPPLCL